MTGTIIVQFSAYGITYHLELKRNITVIKDEGSTGKSLLCNMLETWVNARTSAEAKPFRYNATHNVMPRVLSNTDMTDRVYENWREPHVIFVDEVSHIVETREFASLVANSPHYFVIISRDLGCLGSLSISINSLVSLVGDRYKTLVPWVNSSVGKGANVFKTGNLYSLDARCKRVVPDKLVIEDSNTGYQFFSHVLGDNCIPSGGIINGKPQGGKAKIIKMMLKQCNLTHRPVVAIANGAAFGAEFEYIVLTGLLLDNAYYYLYESFEWLLLHTPTLYVNSKVKALTDSPYVDSSKYLSWERYFTKVLETASRGVRGFEYTKSSLPSGYLQPGVVKALLSYVPEISFDKWVTSPKLLSFDDYTYEYRSLDSCLALFRKNASKIRCAKGYYVASKIPAVVFYSPSEQKVYFTQSKFAGLNDFTGIRLTKEQVLTMLGGK